ncbi:trypsin-like peptidase domain-containing protein [Streptomyces sp. NPDC059582]|uniref:S1C family serine protease n=1 Tax=Streptomyces sp. NPDC059582 TaxID=3346875 RepID=UPI00368D04DC
MNEGKPTKAKWWNRPRPRTRPDHPAYGDGDFELERPAAMADAEPFPAPAVVPTAPAPAPVPGQGTGFGAEATASAGERPRPLHDPDPYSTPPYGEAGPWAPAPPVQHPAVTATPTHGTTVPAPAPAADALGRPAPAVSAQGTPTPGPSGQGTPAPGTPVPSAPDAVTPAPFPEDRPPLSGTRAPGDPWQRYDPWAAAPLATAAPLTAAPLQLNGAAVPGERQRRRRVRRGIVGGAVVLALVAGGVGGVVGAYLERNGGLGKVELPQAGAVPAGRAPDSVAGIAARALPGVVTLHVTGTEEQGTGTGFVLDTRGYILTNNHVVQPAGTDGRITVVFNGGETAEAEVVGHDSGYDLAVVRVTGVSGLRPIPLGNSDNVRVGDPVVAIGAPFDLEGTVTSGIISAKERPITAGGEADGSDVSYVDALQTDAPINPGNSGGPLLDSQARVIGINSAIQSADNGSDSGTGQPGSIGLGFAIPVNQGKRVAEELINTGRATHPVIGVTLDMDFAGDGARVATKSGAGGSPVTAGGPGDRAGLRAGDVITAVDGRRVHSGEELIVKTRAHRPGDSLELTVERDGRARTITLVLGSADGD